MISAGYRFTVAASALAAVAAAPAFAQRQPSPEQRIERLERQVQQVQRRVFPQGQPADTAGFHTEPAATQASVSNLDNRIGALERQLASFLRQGEENGHRIAQLEAELRRAREQEARLRDLEAKLAALTAAPAVEQAAAAPPAAPAAPKPKVQPTLAVVKQETPAEAPMALADPGEEAYDAGYQLWKSGKYDQAITALRAMASSFPKHRRVSWANNLAGRAMLDKGEARAAAQALLANYRGDPKGERAADSLFYLGQALVKLGEPGKACKAYSELEAVYGPTMRGELKTLLPKAKTAAKCS